MKVVKNISLPCFGKQFKSRMIIFFHPGNDRLVSSACCASNCLPDVIEDPLTEVSIPGPVKLLPTLSWATAE